jgi:hypothetical protein
VQAPKPLRLLVMAAPLLRAIALLAWLVAPYDVLGQTITTLHGTLYSTGNGYARIMPSRFVRFNEPSACNTTNNFPGMTGTGSGPYAYDPANPGDNYLGYSGRTVDPDGATASFAVMLPAGATLVIVPNLIVPNTTLQSCEYTLYTGPTTPGFPADIDGNGNPDALTDGLLFLRYLFGLRGQALMAGSIGNGAVRTTPAAIEGYLQWLLRGDAAP